MVVLVRRWWPLVLITLAAFWLRTHDLARRPMHADEANNAVMTGELLESGRYAFDPSDHHGPTLYYAALPVAWIRGEKSLAQLSEVSVRLVPAIFGTLGVILLAVFARGLTSGDGASRKLAPSDGEAEDAGVPWAAMAAAAFMAVSPPAVYYSRYYIQETLLVTFTLATLVCAQQWWRRQQTSWAIGTGICIGLMQATKASAPLFLVLAAAAIVVAIRLRPRTEESVGGPRTDSAGRRSGWRAAGVAALAAVITALLLYSSFGTNPRGIVDALGVYLHAATRFGGDAAPTGHEHPWWYYLRLFGWFRAGGLVWHQVAFSGLAVIGFVVAAVRVLRRRTITAPPDTTFISGVALYTLLVVAVYSWFAYKTPWHVVHFVPGLALLTAAALAAVSNLDTGKFVAIAFALVTLGTMYQQTGRVAFLRPADARNPYAYVHSSADVLKFRPLAKAALARAPDQPVHVIIERREYWPLPWYFRGLPNVGYWPEVPADCDGALVIASQTTAEAVRARLRGRYRESFLGLRPDFVCIIFTPLEGTEGGRE
ncbi:MAG: phospholipid carrier-dependent glycosyltransferase [Opitutaceae bacterium]|nr:phospholipid carrier-dependent glycosyltransferase [Opitutaceae bacterium]